MKPLITCQRVLSVVFITSPEKPFLKWQNRIYIGANVVGVFCFVCYSVSSVYTFMVMVSTNLETALYPLAQIFAAGSGLNIIAVAFLFRQKINAIFTRLSEIYESYKDEVSFRYLALAINKSEWLWKIYVKCAVMLVGSFPFISICTALNCWLVHGRFDSNQVFRPTKLILPWDQETLIGFTAETCPNTIVLGIYILLNGVVLILFISLSWILQSFSKMYRHTAKKLNSPGQNQNNEETLRKLIDFQNMAREFFMQLMPVFNPLIMIQLICYMLFLAIAVFKIYLQHKHIDIEMYVFGMSALLGVLILFLYCYFGILSSESFTDMADCLQETDWHELPVKLRKYIVLMIQNAQRPLYYRGFDMITLNLETFCELIQYTFSYFMIFMTLTTK